MEQGSDLLFLSHDERVRCAGCGAAIERGGFVQLARGQGVRCATCAGYAGLVFLPSGDVAMTRRSVAASSRHAVVVEFVRRRNRNERRGVLVEERAIERAKQECARDEAEREQKRAKRRVRDGAADAAYRTEFERRIREFFPSCPPEAARVIAGHACEKHSGRVGRSAAAKEFDPEKIELAVRAHVRHIHTEYDRLRDERAGRHEARARVRGDIERVIRQWRQPAR